MTDSQLITDILCNVKEKMKDYFFLKDETYDKDTINNKTNTLTSQINNKSTVTFSRTLSSGTKIGKITIDGTGTDIYCEKNTDTTYTPASAVPLSDATTGKVGTSTKYAREDHIHPTDKSKVTFSRSLSSGTKIGTITINNTSTDLYCEKNTDTIYTHPTTHPATIITDATAHSNIGSAENAKQSTINTKIDTQLGKKVNTVSGKGLSTNDYTTTEKDKLASLSVHPATHPATIITDATAHSNIGSAANAKQSDINTKIDSKILSLQHPATHPATIITDATAHSNIGSAANATQSTINTKIDTELGKKVNTISGKGLSSNDYTTTEKDKLASITFGAKAKKRVPGIFVSSSLSPNNTPYVNVNRNSSINVIVFNQEDLTQPPTLEDAQNNIIGNGSVVTYVLNGMTHNVDSGGNINISLNPGEYLMHLMFYGGGYYYQIYRTIVLNVKG